MPRILLVASLALPLVPALSACEGAPPTAGPAGSAAASSTAARAAPEPRSVKLVRATARVGERSKTVRKLSLSLGVELWEQGRKVGDNESVRSEAYARTLEVLALVGGVPGKVKVDYERYRVSEKPWDGPKRESTALERRGFVVSALGESFEAEEGGKPLGEADVTALATLHPDLGKEDPLYFVLTARPLLLGAPFPLREPFFRSLTGGLQGKLGAGRAVLERVHEVDGRRVAEVEWTADMTSSEENGLELAWSLRGKLVVGVDPALILSSTVDGDIIASGRLRDPSRKIDLKGAGRLSSERVTTPL